MTYLITGTGSGLGKYLKEKLDGVAFKRSNDLQCFNLNTSCTFDAIVHCAFNQCQNVSSLDLHQYLADNLFFIQKLLTVPHRKFIFISSADVYPRRDFYFKEDDQYSIENITGIYGLTKLMAETLLKNNSKNYLILRSTALLGSYSRPNSLIKLLYEKNCQLTLHPQSRFNYILHQDVLQFIQIALKNDLCGTYNLAATTSIFLEEVAHVFKRDVCFGTYLYQVANICNMKAMAYCEQLSCSSLDNIKRYLMLKE
jgi:nucleoside-diphosphate-sugar epimerase